MANPGVGDSDRVLCPPDGCIDFLCRPIPQPDVYFVNQNRLFDPTQNPRYANDLELPSLLIRYNPVSGINHLHVGPEYGGKHVHNPPKCYELDTIVMGVAGAELNGVTAGARYFGKESPYNRQTFGSTTMDIRAQILQQMCFGFNTITDLVEKYRKIKKAYIITSSDAVIDDIENLFQWTKTSSPTNLDDHTHRLLNLLRNHIARVETKGLEVNFWKVRPEFVTGPSFSAECALLDHFDIDSASGKFSCRCGDCMDDFQHKELEFAKYGMACCACEFGLRLAEKYGKLKKGDKFVLTNNAGVTAATAVMRVDAKGLKFRH